jgi:AcrR family transcriptional regulator
MRSLTITDLEAASGVPRSTIYYYVREGLLPPAQKAAASRAIYTDRHLALLCDIDALKQQGTSLQAIKQRLAAKIDAAGSSEVDLVAEQNEQTRQAILTAAARLFVRKGYKRTRVADIIKEAGITPPVFYGHFPSKQDLFVEAFGIFVKWMRGLVEARLADEPDPGARELTRVHAYLGVQTLSPDLMGLVRSEALHEDQDDALRGAVERSYQDMTQDTLSDLADLRRKAGTRLPASDELMAYGLLGGVENIVMRASWDEHYSRADVL